MIAASASPFGTLLRQLRRERGLTQEALADRAGISVRGVSDLERGVIQAPRRDTLDALADSLALSEEEQRAFRAAARRRPRAEPALTPRQSTLPRPPTPIVGRTREIAELRALLVRSDVQLVTLTGPGGVGKTRLALRVAADLAPDFDGGVWFVSLAPVADAGLIVSTIGAALGVREGRHDSPIDKLVRALEDRHTLLVLDNLEHLPPAAVLGELLGAAPALTILATSRSPLHLRAERVIGIAPLAVPERERGHSLASLVSYPAVALFVQRAQAARSDFQMTEANAASVAEIVRQLDGLPLAIELAAARARVMSPSALLTRLADRLSILTNGPHDLPDRHQTMRAAIAWTYDLLTADEQTIFRRLAVFAGGFSLEGAQTLMPPLDSIAALADKGLLQWDQEADGESRFHMLETIRAFALERLAASGEEKATRRHHATAFLTLVEQAEPKLLAGPAQRKWFDRLAAEHDNLRAALTWTIEHEPEWALRLTAALGSFWYFRGFLVEGREWLERALAASVGTRSLPRAAALANACSLAWAQRDSVAAITFGEEALALFREFGDRRGEAGALRALGAAEIDAVEREPGRAGTLLEEALAIWRELEDPHGQSATLGNLGFLAWTRGEFDRAIERYEEALSIARAIGDHANAAVHLALLGMLASGDDEVSRATKWLDEALILARDLHDPRVAALATEGLAWAAITAAQPAAAARLLGGAEALFAAAGAGLSPPQLVNHQRASEAARTSLGESAFAAAWATGRAWSLDEAVEAARSLDLAPG